MRKCLALLLLLGIVPAWASPKFDGSPFLGEVLESINAGTYTYLRLKTRDGEVWAATMLAEYAKGTKVQLHDPMLMTNFQSKALGRTFDEIIFVSAVSTEKGGLVGSTAQMSAAHKGAAAPVAAAPIAKVTKATGADGRTVAEVYAQKTQLKGRNVVVRGQVVKFSPNIMERNWIHLQDGSGSAKDGTNDLLVTTKGAAKVGDVLTVTGPLKTDVTYGPGYTYAVTLDGATLKK